MLQSIASVIQALPPVEAIAPVEALVGPVLQRLGEALGAAGAVSPFFSLMSYHETDSAHSTPNPRASLRSCSLRSSRALRGG